MHYMACGISSDNILAQVDYNTTTTTTVLRPLYRSTCIRWYLQLRAAGFCWCKVLLPHALTDGNQRIQIREKTLEFFLTVLSTLSQYLFGPGRQRLQLPVVKLNVVKSIFQQLNLPIRSPTSPSPTWKLLV